MINTFGIGKFVLMNKNIEIMNFTTDFKVGKLKVINIEVVAPKLLPRLIRTLGCEEIDAFRSWVDKRIISINRTYTKEILKSIGVQEYDQLELLLMVKGLSLNDTFWIKNIESNDTWEKINLYENSFKDALEYVTFFGHSKSLGGKLTVSPSLTTAGVLPKMWRYEEGKQYLYKSGTREYANAGREPIVEVLAYRIANIFGIDVVKQELVKVDGILANKSVNFTNLSESFIPASDFYMDVRDWTYELISERLGFVEELNTMFVYDYLIGNKDRHHSNFGLIVDADTGDVKRFAPIWDQGAGIIYSSMYMDFPTNHEDDYSQLVLPNTRELAHKLLTDKHKAGIIKVLNNIDSIFTKDIYHYTNKEKQIITDEHYKAMKMFIKWRAEDLLNSL